MAKGFQLYKAQEGTGLPPYLIARPGAEYDPTTVPAAITGAGQGQSGGGGDFLDLFLQSMLGEGGGFGSSSSQSSSQMPVLPPVIELLMEMRARRDSEAARANILSGIVANDLPAGLTNYPGFEMGGLADVLLGIITGKGVEHAQGLLPESARQVNRVGVPVPGEEPPVGDEFSEASALAKAILDAMRIVQTGQSSSGSSQGTSPDIFNSGAAAPTPPSTGGSGDAARRWAESGSISRGQ